MHVPPVRLLQLALLLGGWVAGSGQLRYSVPEEAQRGALVGRLAQDLGLEAAELLPRQFRMVSKEQWDYLEVNTQSGALFIRSRIDREELCAQSPLCTIHLEVILDKPLRVFHVEVEVKDVNDNAPLFSEGEEALSIPESVLPGAQFPLEGASDGDVGTNAQLKYRLSSTEYFAVEEKTNDRRGKSLVLLLKKPLDREQVPVHHLVLTATDGGQPELTGTVQLQITVMDANDNAPVFNQSFYNVKLLENAMEGTLVINLNATDLDEGPNKEISYAFSKHVSSSVKNIFSIDADTGEIRVKGNVDYEDTNLYDIEVEVKDKGFLPLVGHCNVIIEVIDVNDNIPDVSVTSLSVPVPEDSPVETVVALISASDKDSGPNGQVSCSLWPPGLPFKLVSTFKNYYSLVLNEPLDREEVVEYKLLVTAQDQGKPSLSASITLVVPIGDVNDNAPVFAHPSYTVFVKENNPPGAHIFTVSASDPDMAENALVTYWLDEKLLPLSSYISVHSESGRLYALRSLDYEELKLLEFKVNAKDAGLPSLSCNVVVQVFVVDENDNAPEVSEPENTPISLVAPLVAGQIVAKVRALDADSGYNAWLRYELLEATSNHWQVGAYSGEITTAQALHGMEGDSSSQTVLVLVKDHGKPVLSATATLHVSLMMNSQTMHIDGHHFRAGGSPKPVPVSTNIYLIIAICSVSSLFLLAVFTYMAMRCQCQPKEPMVYGPGTATLVCASEVGSWSYSNRHSHILAGVGGESGAKNDLMVFSPNIPVFAENGEVRSGQEMISNSSGQPKPPNPDWRYSASLRAGMQGAVHMDEAGALRVGPGPEQQWPTVSSATTEPEAGEVSPPVGAGVNSNSWTFKYGPGNSKQPGPESKKQTQVSFLLR
uniref:Protocadherin alpha subfamily C, 2 n=1 Tax=Anolis carolinensis TaxID=28377 RepID=G1KYH0_ANOCA